MRWWSSSQLPDGGLRLLGTPILFSTRPHHLARDCSDVEIFLAPKLSHILRRKCWLSGGQFISRRWMAKNLRRKQIFCRSKDLDLGWSVTCQTEKRLKHLLIQTWFGRFQSYGGTVVHLCYLPTSQFRMFPCWCQTSTKVPCSPCICIWIFPMFDGDGRPDSSSVPG